MNPMSIYYTGNMLSSLYKSLQNNKVFQEFVTGIQQKAKENQANGMSKGDSVWAAIEDAANGAADDFYTGKTDSIETTDTQDQSETTDAVNKQKTITMTVDQFDDAVNASKAAGQTEGYMKGSADFKSAMIQANDEFINDKESHKTFGDIMKSAFHLNQDPSLSTIVDNAENIAKDNFSDFVDDTVKSNHVEKYAYDGYDAAAMARYEKAMNDLPVNQYQPESEVDYGMSKA